MRKMVALANLKVSLETLFGYKGYFVETCKAYGKCLLTRAIWT